MSCCGPKYFATKSDYDGSLGPPPSPYHIPLHLTLNPHNTNQQNINSPDYKNNVSTPQYSNDHPSPIVS